MLGKLTGLLVVGFAFIASASSDFSIADQLKQQINVDGKRFYEEATDAQSEAHATKLGAFPAGFLGASQLVSDADRQWLHDQIPSNYQGKPGIMNYRNGDA